MRQLVEIAHQPLYARVDQLLGRATRPGAGIHQPGDVLQQPGVAQPLERRPRRLAAAALDQQSLEQAEQHELLAGDGQVGASRVARVGAEHVPRLIDGLGPAGDDQRPVGGVDAGGVADELLAGRRVDLHARDEEQVGHAAVEAHLGRAEVAVPLLEDDAGLGESRVEEGGTDSAHAGRGHARVGVDERQHARTVVERAGNDGGQIVAGRQRTESLAEGEQLTGTAQLVATRAAGKLHRNLSSTAGRTARRAGGRGVARGAASRRGRRGRRQSVGPNTPISYAAGRRASNGMCGGRPGPRPGFRALRVLCPCRPLRSRGTERERTLAVTGPTGQPSGVATTGRAAP